MDETVVSCSRCHWSFDPHCMEAAFAAAHSALSAGEVAVGCALVEVKSRRVVATGFNRTNADHHALGHAEFVAVAALQSSLIENGSPPLSSLAGYELYVTVEPCMMCAAMLALNRIAHVFYGCSNPRFGGNGGVCEVQRGLYCSSGGFQAERAVRLLQTFYQQENDAAPDHKRRRKVDVQDGGDGGADVA